MAKITKFQSVKVKFPKEFFLAASWMVLDNKQLVYHTHDKVYYHPKEAIKESKYLYKHLKKDGINILPHILLAKLSFIEKKPLKKLFWDNPVVKYDEMERFRQFIRPFDDYKSYKVMVTPADVTKNIFTAPIAFLLSAPVEDIELFMRSSDWQVDGLADSYAFYKIDSVNGINIFTGEVVNKNKEEALKKKFVN